MRRIVCDGRALGLFVEGTRQRSGVPGEVQPGAAMVALQEGVPIVPVAIHGSQFWKPGNLSPCSIAWGEPMTLDGLPKGGKGYKEASVAAPGGDPPPLGLARSRSTGSGGRTASRPRRAADAAHGGRLF